ERLEGLARPSDVELEAAYGVELGAEAEVDAPALEASAGRLLDRELVLLELVGQLHPKIEEAMVDRAGLGEIATGAEARGPGAETSHAAHLRSGGGAGRRGRGARGRTRWRPCCGC